MPDTERDDDKQPKLPGVDDSVVKAAEKRAKEAEERAAKLESEERKRQDALTKAKRDAEVKSLDDAKRALEEAERRAAEAEQRAKEAEDRIRKRIDARFEQLPAEHRERLSSFREAMPLDKWEALVDMELERTPATGDSTGETGTSAGIPPASPAGVGRRVHKREGRELHPKTVEILDALGQDPSLSQRVLQVETEKEGGVIRGRFIYPQGLLKKHLRERALAPTLMTEENRRKIYGE